jgi:hypothetical protein
LVALLGLAIVVAAFGALVLLRFPERPGGTIAWKGLNVSSKGAGLPLIVLGVVAAGFAAIHLPSRPNAVTPRANPGSISVSPFGSEVTLTVSTSSGPAGTVLTVGGSGFAAGEKVRIEFSTEQLAEPRADSKGSFSNVSIQIPADWAFKGQEDIIAAGETSFRFQTEPFRVT